MFSRRVFGEVPGSVVCCFWCDVGDVSRKLVLSDICIPSAVLQPHARSMKKAAKAAAAPKAMKAKKA